MSFSMGIVGLPNVGKSTLFETITKKQVDRANYPFCTIDPNVGVVAVPDERVDRLAELCHSRKKIYTTVEFIDIAGLIKGAAQGQGLGNKFLANIRETDAIVYVLRCFRNSDIVSTSDSIDPLRDKGILDTELILKDLETVSARLESLEREIRGGKKEALKEREVLEKAREFLNNGKILAEAVDDSEEKGILKNYQLLTLKPRIYLLNGKDDEVADSILEEFKKNNWPYLIIDVATEFELADMSHDDRRSLGVSQEPELETLIKKAHETLGLITFLTTGEDETRAWTLKRGGFAPQAGGAIHSDFERCFIKAEAINWKTLLDAGGFPQAREKGLIRTEGKNYMVQDGDVIEIKANA